MNLQELRTFLAIIDTGSLVRASEVLNVTQSTVTARLKSLEDTLGQTLLIRSKSGATLTAAGQRLHRYAGTITELWQQARQEVSLPAGMSGMCNLVCDFDLWPNLGDAFFQKMTNDLPDLAISIWLGNQGDIAKWMEDGKADLAITYRSATSARQDQITLQPDLIRLFTTQSATCDAFAPGSVYIEAGDTFGRDHAATYADAKVARLSFGNATIGLDHVLKEGGSAYFPVRLIAKHVRDRTLFPIPNAPAFHRNVYVTYNKAARANWDWFEQMIVTLPCL